MAAQTSWNREPIDHGNPHGYQKTENTTAPWRKTPDSILFRKKKKTANWGRSFKDELVAGASYELL
jgi:hypothetical protein